MAKWNPNAIKQTPQTVFSLENWMQISLEHHSSSVTFQKSYQEKFNFSTSRSWVNKAENNTERQRPSVVLKTALSSAKYADEKVRVQEVDEGRKKWHIINYYYYYFMFLGSLPSLTPELVALGGKIYRPYQKVLLTVSYTWYFLVNF